MDNILNNIHSPEDLKKLKHSQLLLLCQELREDLLLNVSKTGGHLASNLGVVELTVALHYVMNLPEDQIIWDVGHQAYIHKMLTGRLDRMGTLRKFKGLSGFPKRTESSYDDFGTGHSSTAISAALGMAIARDLCNEDYHVTAIVGDGAMTGGMSLEGLSHAGHEGRNILVILNDNEMSISRNEGAISSHLNHLRSNPVYHHTKDKISSFLNDIPFIGGALETGVRSIKEAVRFIALKSGTLFESLGWNYIGPIDGHDLNVLIPVLRNTLYLKGPILLHVVTKKGKGYLPAEKNPDFFHGVGPFDIETGKTIGKSYRKYTNVFTDFIMAQGENNPRVVAITAAMAGGTGLEPFAEKYPDRFFDVGICEQHAVTLAAGMACKGLRPIVCIYSTFLQRAVDQVIHDVAIQNLPVVFAVDRAGLVGDDGATHQGVFDIALLRSIPNIRIYCPINEREMTLMLEEAVKADGPVIIRYPRGEVARVSDLDSFEKKSDALSGIAQILREGSAFAILSTGMATSIAFNVIELLEAKQVHPSWVHFPSVKPLDDAMLKKIANEFIRIVIIEDSVLSGGFGSAILEFFNDYNINVDVLRIGIPDVFVEQGKVCELWDSLDMSPEKIVLKIEKRWQNIFDLGSN